MINKLVIYSGGMDSYTLLNELYSGLDDIAELYAISFNYGQKHSKELVYARNVTEELNISHRVVDLRGIFSLGGALLDDTVPVPEGHYESETMRRTVVPARNMIMIATAVSYAASIEVNEIFYGAHAGDHAIYPDCRPPFVSAMNLAISEGVYKPPRLTAPYINMSKADIAMVGKNLGLDYNKAWTCYNGREKACGKCGACQERVEAMHYASVLDPMEYE